MFRHIVAIISTFVIIGTSVWADPLIRNWASSGGQVEFKENEQDLIYKVKEGDKIIFTITTNEPCVHYWKVWKGSCVLHTSKKKDTTASQFAFTIPDEKASWDIEVEVYYRKPAIGPYRKNYKRWSITTSAIRLVKPGESIQEAINSLPKGGGIVELSAGMHQIGRTVYIAKSNITLRGAGANRTTIRCPQKHTVIIVSAWQAEATKRSNYVYNSMIYKQHGNWFHDIAMKMIKENNKNISISPPEKDKFISNVIVEELCIRGEGEAKARGQSGLRFFFVHDCQVCNVKVEECAMHGIGWAYCFRMLMENCKLIHNGVFDPFGSFACEIINNEFINSWRFHGLKFNGGGLYLVRGNRWVKPADSIYFYAGGPFTFINNVIDGSGRSGISIHLSSGNLIRNNIVMNCKGAGIHIFGTSHGASHRWKSCLYNNVIYRNKKDGLFLKENIDTYEIDLRNNIIVGNSGWGIRVSAEKSKKKGLLTFKYNNVWNNAKGAYEGIAPDANSISTDPLFADPSAGDFHLKSKAGRWSPKLRKWVQDDISSPCIDAGDPTSSFSDEPLPNGGRVNMGAYGNTAEASKSLK